MDIKSYKQKSEYSYTLGAFPTYELIQNMPGIVKAVLVHSSFTDRKKLEKLCRTWNIEIRTDDKTIARLSDKENVYVIGVFDKYRSALNTDRKHLMLVNPSNMGNVGTIIRTAAAFDFTDLAIIKPGVDIFNPKVVRGSMGAMFRMNIDYFDSFEQYSEYYVKDSGRKCYSFMLSDKAEKLVPEAVPAGDNYSLIFGNEATGLPGEYATWAKPFMIPQSDMVDSLNLTIAAGIGMYLFSGKKL